ncbi:MAG: hypothetical protein V2B18_01030 [Pseudomonadota bacterium]
MSERIERLMFACADLLIEKETAPLEDMLDFYMEGGRMLVAGEEVPTLSVIPWLQAQSDYDKRETMRDECRIYFKAILNPILIGIVDLTQRSVREKCGFDDYLKYCEAKKRVSFDAYAPRLSDYLDSTQDAYVSRMAPWVRSELGREFDRISHYHALYLLRIRGFDEYFPESRLLDLIYATFGGLGVDLATTPGIVFDIGSQPSKIPDGVCIGVDIPGDVHVVMNPVGGFIDAETILHEAGHAFFLSQMDPELPMEYRRLYRSPALDESFAFLFADLLGNPRWLTSVAGMPIASAEEQARLYANKRLCLIRRHIGKFLAQKEFFEKGRLKDQSPYLHYLERATGFVYQPEAYLMDMEADFYAFDYVMGWAGSSVLGAFLEAEFGPDWFGRAETGRFLTAMARSGRRMSLDDALTTFCGSGPRLPEFLSGD